MHGWVALGEVWCTDDAAALAVWIPPGRPEIDFESGSSEEPPPDLLERFAIIAPAMDANTPDEPHWYLQLLATHPDWQRQGLGAELMAVTFARAEADGLPCYLETETVENVGVLPPPRVRGALRVGHPHRPPHVGHVPPRHVTGALPTPSPV